MNSANISTQPFTRGKKRAAEAEEQKKRKEAEMEKRRQKMFKPRKIKGALPTSGMVTLFGPNDILVSRKNPQKIQIKEEVEEKPMVTGTPGDEEVEMEAEYSSTHLPNQAEVKIEAPAEIGPEFSSEGKNEALSLGVEDIQDSGEATLGTHVEDSSTVSLDQELEVQEKLTVAETPNDEEEMDMEDSIALLQNQSAVNLDVTADTELRSCEDDEVNSDVEDSEGHAEEGPLGANVKAGNACTRCQELEKIGSEKDLRIKELEQELETLKQKYEDPISKLCLEVDAKDARSNKLEDNVNPIFLAISEGKSKEEIQRLVESGEKWDVPNANEDTALHLAAKYGSPALVEYIISISDKPDVNKYNSFKSTPLMEAAQFSKNFLEVFKIFMEHGADLENEDWSNTGVLYHAIKSGRSAAEIEEIMKFTKNRDSRYFTGMGMDGFTVLHLAVENGNLEAVKYFLSLNSNVNAIDDMDYYTPLMKAAAYAKQNFLPIADILLQHGADITLLDDVGYSVLFLAIYSGRPLNDLKKLVSAGACWNTAANDGETTLHACAEHGHAEAMKYFIEKGADLNAQDISGKTPIMIAAENGMCDAMKVLIEKGAVFEASELLNEALANIGNEITEEHEFREKSLCGTIKTLVDLEAISEGNESQARCIDARDYRGTTPLMRTILGATLQLEVFELLMNLGANINTIDENGFNVLHHATSMYYYHQPGRPLEILEKLISHGATWSNGLVGNQKREESILHAAVRGGRPDVVQFFISKGVDVNAKDARGDTPFLLAAREPNQCGEILRVLVKAGADTNSVDKDGNNALLLAARTWFTYRDPMILEKLKLLIAFGCDISIPNYEGKTFRSMLIVEETR